MNVVEEGLAVGGDKDGDRAVNALWDNALVERQRDRGGHASDEHLTEERRRGSRSVNGW